MRKIPSKDVIICSATICKLYKSRSKGIGWVDDIQATYELFEKNVEKARAALKSITEEDLQDQWTMKAGGKTVMGPFPRGLVVRSFLFNHIYHHRGEMIIYLRSTGQKVPGLYGPTYEDGKVDK